MASTRTETGRARWWLVADGLAKATLVGLLMLALLRLDLDRFAGKGMPARAIGYPLLVAVVPALWLGQRSRARRSGAPEPPYPALVALLVTAPFVIDLAGNALDLFDRVDVFDDLCHFGNWALLSGAVGVALVGRRDLPGWLVAAVCTGFGATTAILWELVEYAGSIDEGPERVTIYRDTVGDLVLGLFGSVLAGLACAFAGRTGAADRAVSGSDRSRPADPAPTRC